MNSLLPAAAKPPDRGKLRNGTGKFALRRGDFFLRGLVLQRFLGALLGFERLRLVEIPRPDRGVREHGNDVRLNLEEAALHENNLRFLLSGNLDSHFPWL